MPYVGEARIRYKGPPAACAPYIRVARVLAERVLEMYDMPGSVDTATHTARLDDGAVVRVTVFVDVPPIITIEPPPVPREDAEERYRRCYNGLVVDYVPEDTEPLSEGKGWLKLAGSEGLLPADEVTGHVVWDHPDLSQRIWPMPLDSQMAVQYRPGLEEPHYLSGSGAQLCDRSGEWYWQHDGVVWRVEVRTTEPVELADPEPELTDENTREMPLDYDATTIPTKLSDSPVLPDVETEPSYQLDDVLYAVYSITEIVERVKWKVGLLLKETPIRVLGTGSLPEPRQRVVWVKFEGPTRNERYTSRGHTESTPVWGHLRLHEVTAAGVVLTVVGTIAFVEEASSTHVVRGFGASDRGVVELAPDLTYSVTENPNPIYDTEQDNRTAIPNEGQTIPVVRWSLVRDTVQTNTNPDQFETTDTYEASIAYEDPSTLDPYDPGREWSIPHSSEAERWRFTVVPPHHSSGIALLYDTVFSWGPVKVEESWTFDYERTSTALPALEVNASATAVHGDDIQNEVTARSVEGNAEGRIDMVADQQLAATYTITVGTQIFTVQFDAVCTVNDEIGWAWGADPADLGPIGSLPASLISAGIHVSENGDGSYFGGRHWEMTLTLDDQQYGFSFTDDEFESWKLYLNERDNVPRYTLIPSDRTNAFLLPFGMTEFLKHRVGEVVGTYVGNPTPQRVYRSLPVVSTVARPGLLYVKFTFTQFEYNSPAFSVDYVFTAAGDKVLMHPNNEIAAANKDDDVFFDHLQIQEPLDPQTAAAASTLPIDACYNPETQQLYVRYPDDPPGCFVQMAEVNRTLYKVKPGEERPDDIVIPRRE